MRISVHAPHAAPGIIERVNERVQAALRRYEAAIRNVVVRVRDENGPRGGTDQSCLVRIAVRGAPEIVVRQRGERPLAAIGGALKRARRRLGERVNARARRRERRSQEE